MVHKNDRRKLRQESTQEGNSIISRGREDKKKNSKLKERMKKRNKNPLINYELRTNKEIADEAVSSGLLDDCIYFQFQKIKKTEPWKCQFSGDLKNDIYLVLLDYDNAKLNDAYHRHFNAFITRIILNNVLSTSSNFHSWYFKFMNKSNDFTDTPDYEDN